jgi:E3 ubiquitin-protein ligase RNF115/126
MKVILHYNDFIKEIDIDCTKKNGILQENLLNYCSLMIYNIENTEIVLKKNGDNISKSPVKDNIDEIRREEHDSDSIESYILGSDELDFNDTLEKITNNYIIVKIIIHDRKRDKDGNVIKNNYIIDRYNKWYQINEDENYINNINNSNMNRHILRFPLTTLLTSILNVPINELIPQNNTPSPERDCSEADLEEAVESNNSQPLENSVENDVGEKKSEEIIPSEIEELNNEENIMIHSHMTSDSTKSPCEKILNECDNQSSSEQVLNELVESIKETEDDEDASIKEIEDDEDIQETDNDEENNTENINNINLVNQNYSRINNLINIFDDYMNMSNNLLNDSFINRLETDINSMNNIFIYSEQSPILVENIPNLTSSYDQPIFGTTRQSETQYQPRIRSLYYNINNDIHLGSFMNYYIPNNQIPLQEDVKIVLNDTQFDNLETIKYEDLNKEHECLICLDKFNESDNIKKITCNHIFHNNCIKSWLCEESNKCPVCRIEVDKGNPKEIINSDN